MSVDKFKTGAEAAKVVLDIVTTLVDRSEKKKAQEKRIAELEAEIERLKSEKGDKP